jgi:hypothetical protein
MGADFIEKTKDVFRKCWDRGLRDLNTPDLFSRGGRAHNKRLEAELVGRTPPSVGDHLVICEVGGDLIGLHGLDPAVKFNDPPQEVRDGMTSSCGLAHGVVAAVDTIGGVAEVIIEPSKD